MPGGPGRPSTPGRPGTPDPPGTDKVWLGRVEGLWSRRHYYARFMSSYTALRNHNRIVYKEMSSWTALTWYIGKKTAF